MHGVSNGNSSPPSWKRLVCYYVWMMFSTGEEAAITGQQRKWRSGPQRQRSEPRRQWLPFAKDRAILGVTEYQTGKGGDLYTKAAPS